MTAARGEERESGVKDMDKEREGGKTRETWIRQGRYEKEEREEEVEAKRDGGVELLGRWGGGGWHYSSLYIITTRLIIIITVS